MTARLLPSDRLLIIGMAACAVLVAGCSDDAVWSVEVEEGVAAIAVDDEHIYVSSGREHGLEDRRPLLVFESATGEQQGTVGDPVLRYEMEPVPGGVVAARDREVCRFDADGAQRWCTDVGPMPDDPAIEGSFSRRTQLAVDGDTVVASAWESPLTGLDLASGEPRWMVDDLENLSPSFLAAHDGVVAVREVAKGELLLVGTDDGAVRWRQPLEVEGQEFNYPRTWIDASVVIAADGPRALAYDRATGDLLWEQRFDDVTAASGAPLVLDGVVVGVWHGSMFTDDPATVIGVDLATGEQRWSQTVAGLQRAAPRPVDLTDLGDGRLLIAGESLRVVDASTGEMEGEPFGSRGSALPVTLVDGDAVVIDEEDRIVRLRIPD